MEAIILAGGKGTRLQSVVSDVPKPMAPIGDKPFLAYLMEYWRRQGVTHFILSTGYKAELVEAALGNSYQGCPISYAQEKEPLGTGGGIRLATEFLNDEAPFLVMNGDTFFESELEHLEHFHQGHSGSVSIALVQVPRNDRYGGVELAANGKIENFDSAQVGTTGVLVNAGVYMLSPRAVLELNAEPARFSFEAEWLPKMVKQGEIYGSVESRYFIDIGIPTSYEASIEQLPQRMEQI